MPATAVGDLEAAARGSEPGGLEGRFEEVYRTQGVEAPGLAPADPAAAVTAVVGG